MHIQLEDAQGSGLCLPTTTRMQADILCIDPLLHLETFPEGKQIQVGLFLQITKMHLKQPFGPQRLAQTKASTYR